MTTLTIYQLSRDRLGEWQHYYNWERNHGALGKPPMDRYFELQDRTPSWAEMIENFNRATERFREQSYILDRRLVEMIFANHTDQIYS